MALVTKNDVTQIFAIQAPAIDLPPTFSNYPRGWDAARSNNGKPTIKQFNYIQQRTDQNVLWIHQNGAALPYDAAMEYAENAHVVKDGDLQKKQGASWVSATNKGYNLDYFIEGKAYPLHAEIMLANGNIVKSTVANNIINPNVDMTGWVYAETSSKSKLSNKISTTSDFGNIELISQEILLSDVYQSLDSAKADFHFLTDLTGSYGWAVLQKQFNALSTNKYEKAVISGTVFVNKPLKYEAKSNVEFNASLKLSGGAIGQYAIEFNNTDMSKLSGKISLSCYVSDTYDVHNWGIRSWWDGVLFKRVTTTDNTSLMIEGRLKGQLVNIDGIANNGNYASFGMITGTCGSMAGDWLVTITAVSNLGDENSSTQTAELTLSVALPSEVVGHIVKIGTDYHYIRAVSGNKITVEMWVNPVNTLLHVIYGGIAKSNGDNANGISFKLLRGFRSATTYSCATTMGAVVSTFGSEYNEIGLIAGAGYGTNATLNYLEIGQWYSEFNALDILDTRSSVSQSEFVKIKSEVGLGTANWPSNVFKASAKDNAFIRNKLYEKPNVLFGEKWPRLLVGNSSFSESTRYIYIGETREHIFKNDTQTIQLDCASRKVKNYGRNTAEITQIGSGLNGGVTRTVLQCFPPFTFRNPSETNGRYYYLGRTSKPRELKIVVNDDNIIDVYEVNTDAPQLLTDLSLKTGTGVFRFNVATTANLGTNPPTTSGVIRVQLYSVDTYVYEAVEEMFCYNGSGVLTARKLRTKRGDNITPWLDLPIERLNSIPALDTATATANQIATALNSLIADLKANKYMKL